MNPSNMELEAKFFVSDLSAIKSHLESLQARLVQPRTYERNLRFDTPEGELSQKNQLLRLREDSGNRLTFKGPGEVQDGVSARIEIEFTVGEFDQAETLLKALGYQVCMIYEKYRTSYELNGVEITLDEMPFGNFIEIEGADGASIHAVCQELKLVWELRTLQSYAMLFEQVKKNLGLAFRDLTFENFSQIQVKPSNLEMAPADIRS